MRHFARMVRIVVIESWRLLSRGSPHPEGWITPAFRMILWFLSLLSTVAIDLAGFRYRTLPRAQSSQAGAVITDSFVAACALTGLALYIWLEIEPRIQWIAASFAVWRIVDILATLLRMVLFHRSSGWKHTTGYLAAKERTVVLSLVNYLEVMVCFGILYAHSRADLVIPSGEHDIWSPLYFSGITQMTIGFGDIRPHGFTRLVATTQALVGILMIAIFVSRFVSTLGPTRALNDTSLDGLPSAKKSHADEVSHR